MLTLVSCGDQPASTAKDGVGDVRGYSPITVGGVTLQKIENVCQAIGYKTSVLNQYNNQEFTFSVLSTPCRKPDIAVNNSPVDMKVIVDGQQFRGVGAAFPFSEIETSGAGVMATICNAWRTNRLTSPMLDAANGASALWIASIATSKDCTADATHECILVERGQNDVGQNYNIITREVMKFEISGSRRGFYTSRTRSSSVACASGEIQTQRVDLK
jgi:hypothetical protein